MRIALLCLFLFFLSSFKAQNRVLDSLFILKKNSKADTSKIELLLKISREFNKLKNDSSFYYANQALSLSKERNIKKGIARSYEHIVYLFNTNKRFIESYNIINEFEKLIKAQEDTLFVLSMLRCRINLYKKLDQLDKVAEIEKQRIKIFHAEKDTKKEAISYYVLGWSLYNLKEYNSAIKYLHEGRRLCLMVNDTNTLQKTYNWLGASYSGLLQFDSALYYASATMTINKKRLHPYYIAESYRYTGDIYSNMSNYNTAIAYYDSAIVTYSINHSVDREFLLRTYRIRTLDKLKQYREAQRELDFVLSHSKDFKEPLAFKAAFDFGKKIYALNGNLVKAIYCYRASDSIQTINKTDEIEQRILTAEFKKEQEKIDEINKSELRQQETTHNLETEKQNNIRNILIGSVIFVSVLAIFILRNLQQNKKTAKIISNQKMELEEKQKEIVDSINYAKRIQYTLLAHDELLKNNLNEHFVLFNPKDIVSGDFYWATEHNNKFYLAICDSTGHGVPGAFMSLLNIGFLTEAITEKGIEKPNEIFEFVREKLISTISKDGQKDGFDGILVCLDKVDRSITYAAAHNAPVFVSSSKIIQLEADRMPVGIGELKNKFILRKIVASRGDCLYLYTDGFADQFGGPKGKKFKYKQLNDFLIEINGLEMEGQKTALSRKFFDWKGSLEQIDDVLIVGIRF